MQLGLLGAFSFVFAVGVAIFTDPIVHDEILRLSVPYHPARPGVLLFAVPAGILVYSVNSRKKMKRWSASLLTFLASSALGIAGAFLLSYPNSIYPHLGVLAPALSYSLLLGLTAFVERTRINFPWITQREIDVGARIERVKLVFQLWFGTLTLIITVIIVATSVTVLQSLEIAQKYFGENIEAARLVHHGTSIQAAYLGTHVVAFTWLMLRRLTQMSEKLGDVKRHDSSQASSQTR